MLRRVAVYCWGGLFELRMTAAVTAAFMCFREGTFALLQREIAQSRTIVVRMPVIRPLDASM